ncbi:MAG: Asp-tRNA(Asn)/Glu-tRNA(Gln) amidotransferase subunit GatB [bacterium]
MSDYKLTVGLEIHAELNTRTKMFCNSKNDPDEIKPNHNVCPVCMGHPGTLPVINKGAVRSVLRLGVAVGGKLADYTEFDRKNYFYPDIPKGYQISQYKYPLVSGGEIIGVPLTRIHLEEDTAKSIHNQPNNSSFALRKDESLLDFNRAGVPLMELVTEPAIHNAETAAKFAREFQLLLLYLGISEANMEKGEMRVEANISVSRSDLGNPKKVGPLGTKVEVKNLNSFKSVEKAIKYEFDRQAELLEAGKEVIQETRGWDEEKEETFSQRAKEESHDYRYFPDPDLPKLFLSEIPEFAEKALRITLPELPKGRRLRYKVEFGLRVEEAEVFVKDEEKRGLLEKTVKTLGHPMSKWAKLAVNYITTDLKRPIPAESLAVVIMMVEKGQLSSRGAKNLLKMLEEQGGNPKELAETRGLLQKSDMEELKKIAKQVVTENPKVVEEYKKGKVTSLQFLIGQAMKAMKGSGNPQVLKKVFEEILN